MESGLDGRILGEQSFGAEARADDNRVGPSLYGVVGRKAGTEPGFSYTESLKDSGVTHTTGLPSFNAATSVLGCPTITLPLLAVSGLPVGVPVIAQRHEDAALTGLARWAMDHLKPVVV